MSSLLGTQVHSADLADAVSRLRRAMRRAARAADPGSGLSVAQLEMLSCMAENPGSRPGQLARLLRLAPSSVATLSNSLRQGGLVTRTGGEGDRRTASLDLTPAGETAVLRWKTLNERLLGLALRDLPPDTRVTLVDALPALADLAGAVDALADEPSAPDAVAGETSLAGRPPWRARPRARIRAILPAPDNRQRPGGPRPIELAAEVGAAPISGAVPAAARAAGGDVAGGNSSPGRLSCAVQVEFCAGMRI